MSVLWRAARPAPSSLTLPAICGLFQDAARAHASELGLGVADLHAASRAWILSRLALRVHQLPEPCEMVEVLSWPSRRTAGVRARREFEIRAPGGDLLVEACSVWLILDRVSRRPARLPAGLLHLDFPARDTAIEPLSIPEPAEAALFTGCHKILAGDLDENNHANNVSYIQWACNALSADFLAAHTPAELHVEYLAEALLGDNVQIAACPDGRGRLLHRLSTSGRTLARLLTTWRPAEAPVSTAGAST
ncbi:MAG: hypothetical protein HY858_04025 [Candidatus Solibacter usitatus]|nr:hypothetical protein [Candidatus Solibacter usitatus]